MPDTDLLTLPTSEFLEAVLRSGVVEEGLLDATVRRFEQKLAKVKGDTADVELADPTDLAKYLIRKKLLTRYQAKELLQGRFRKLKLERFVILDLLGVGGMGSVFRAFDPQRDEEVALKVLSERFKHDSGMRARFSMEARAGMKLDHPGVVRTYEFGVTDDVFGQVDYATMEMFEGIALHELIGIMGPLPVNAACDIISQSAEALGYLHAQGMVHRDVKPDNVLIDKTGRVKIIDFGLTLVNEAPEGEEFSLAMIFGHDCLGTPDYMPPEQAEDSLAADARSDVYGLGCTLYVALTGTRPFSANTGTELIQMHKSHPPPTPRDVIESTPPEIARAVRAMMAKSPDDRPQTMVDVCERLQRFSKRRAIEFSFSQLIKNRMALAIKQGRLSQRRTSTVMRLSSAGRQTKHRSDLTGHATGSSAALKATGAPRDTVVTQGVSHKTDGRSPSSEGSTAATGAEELLRGFTGRSSDEEAAHCRASLRLADGGLFRLAKANIVIGRNQDEADLWLDDKLLSGRHCRLTYDGDAWHVIDLDSRNGTQINGRRISMAPLFGGDTLALGTDTQMTMEWSRRRVASNKGPLLWTMSIIGVAAFTLAAYLWLW